MGGPAISVTVGNCARDHGHEVERPSVLRPQKPACWHMSKSPARKFRCAIYSRKSSEEGLEQEFNSLDAQAPGLKVGRKRTDRARTLGTAGMVRRCVQGRYAARLRLAFTQAARSCSVAGNPGRKWLENLPEARSDLAKRCRIEALCRSEMARADQASRASN